CRRGVDVTGRGGGQLLGRERSSSCAEGSSNGEMATVEDHQLLFSSPDATIAA
ncbi:hypothetical protein Dimus_030432, partial [Dionaea muscipula]